MYWLANKSRRRKSISKFEIVDSSVCCNAYTWFIKWKYVIWYKYTGGRSGLEVAGTHGIQAARNWIEENTNCRNHKKDITTRKGSIKTLKEGRWLDSNQDQSGNGRSYSPISCRKMKDCTEKLLKKNKIKEHPWRDANINKIQIYLRSNPKGWQTLN